MLESLIEYAPGHLNERVAFSINHHQPPINNESIITDRPIDNWSIHSETFQPDRRVSHATPVRRRQLSPSIQAAPPPMRTSPDRAAVHRTRNWKWSAPTRPPPRARSPRRHPPCERRHRRSIA